MASATAPSATAAPGFRHVVTARRALAARRAGFAGGANLLARPSAPAAPDRDARVQTVADGERGRGGGGRGARIGEPRRDATRENLLLPSPPHARNDVARVVGFSPPDSSAASRPFARSVRLAPPSPLDRVSSPLPRSTPLPPPPSFRQAAAGAAGAVAVAVAAAASSAASASRATARPTSGRRSSTRRTSPSPISSRTRRALFVPTARTAAATSSSPPARRRRPSTYPRAACTTTRPSSSYPSAVWARSA